MKKIILIGGGKLAREIISSFKDKANIVGYVEKKRTNIKKKYYSEKYFNNKDKCHLVISVGDIKLRSSLFDKYKNKNKFINLISSNSFVSSDVKIGNGSVISPNCFIGSNVSIGKNVFIGSNVSISHDCVIGNNSYISPSVCIGGCVNIKKNFFAGLNSTILPDINIGSNCFVGAMSIIRKNIPDNKLIVGNSREI